MKTLQKTFALVTFSLASGCAGNMRSPAQWDTDSQALLATHSEAIKACYNEALKKSPKLSGAVVVSYTIEPETGALKKAKLDEARTTAAAPARKCVLDNLLELKLAPPDANIGQGTNTWIFTATEAPVAPAEAAPASAPPAS